MRDDVGDLMKAKEAESRLVLPSKTFHVIRIDGRAFHSYTRSCERPFDARFAADMDATALALVAEISGSLTAFVQSDEISIISSDLISERAEPWFGGVVQKVVSVAASLATATFNQKRSDVSTSTALFDARVFSLGTEEEVTAYLAWRQADASRNAISMLAHHFLGHKAINRVPTSTRRTMLLDAGIDISSYPEGFLRGQAAFKECVVGDVEFTHKVSGELHIF